MSSAVTERHVRPSRWLNRNVVAMALTSLLSDWGHEMATAALPGFAAVLAMGPFALGAIEGVADALSSAVKLWAGRWSDRSRHRKAVATSGYVLTGASKALFALAHGWPIILVGRVVGWFGRGIRGPVRDAMLAESVPVAQVGRAFGFHRAGDTIGALLGPATTLVLLAWQQPHEATYRTIFVLTLVPGLASALVFGAWTEDPRPRLRPTIVPVVDDTPSRVSSSAYHRFLSGVALFGLADFAPTLLMLRASAVLTPAMGAGAAATAAVALYTLRNAVEAVAAYPAGALSDRLPRTAVLAGGYALLIVVAAGAAWPVASLVFFAALFALSGVLAGVQDVVEGASIAALVPVHRRGSAYGALAAINGVGDFCSSVVIGVLWTWWSAAGAFGVAAAFAVAGSVVMATVPRSRTAR